MDSDAQQKSMCSTSADDIDRFFRHIATKLLPPSAPFAFLLTPAAWALCKEEPLEPKLLRRLCREYRSNTHIFIPIPCGEPGVFDPSVAARYAHPDFHDHMSVDDTPGWYDQAADFAAADAGSSSAAASAGHVPTEPLQAPPSDTPDSTIDLSLKGHAMDTDIVSNWRDPDNNDCSMADDNARQSTGHLKSTFVGRSDDPEETESLADHGPQSRKMWMLGVLDSLNGRFIVYDPTPGRHPRAQLVNQMLATHIGLKPLQLVHATNIMADSGSQEARWVCYIARELAYCRLLQAESGTSINCSVRDMRISMKNAREHIKWVSKFDSEHNPEHWQLEIKSRGVGPAYQARRPARFTPLVEGHTEYPDSEGWAISNPLVREAGQPVGQDTDAVMNDQGASIGGDATTVDADGDATMTDAAGGDTTTTDAAGGDTMMADAAGGDATTTDAAGGDATMADAADGDVTTTDAAGGDATMTDAAGGHATMTDAAGGDATMVAAGAGIHMARSQLKRGPPSPQPDNARKAKKVKLMDGQVFPSFSPVEQSQPKQD